MKCILTLFSAAIAFAIPAAAQSYIDNGIRGEIVAGVTDSFDKLIDLAQAIPEEQYPWRPQTGVRSVREVLLHVVGSSYYFTNVIGSPYPEGLDLRSMDSSLTAKADLVRTLQDARDHTLEALISLEEEALDRRVEWYGGTEGTVRGALILLSNHSAEHLGQLVAYARINGVTPPWSEQ